MFSIDESDTFMLGDRVVERLGYGAMQLAGPGYSDLPIIIMKRSPYCARSSRAVLTIIDTADFYGPHITNRIIRKALQSSTLSVVAARLEATPMQVALAWLLQRSPNILLIPGTSSVAHLRENLKSAALTLSESELGQLDGIDSSLIFGRFADGARCRSPRRSSNSWRPPQ